MELVRTFEQIGKDDAAIAGGKGASLGEMTSAFAKASAGQAGAYNPVPPGFVILASAFERFLEEADLNQEIDTIILHGVNREEMHTVERASEKIQQLILEAKMPDDIQAEIKREFTKLGAQFVAVRSSATAEDSQSAAWAGQLDTFLNTTSDTLLENVQKCWASLFTPRAIFYRFEKNMHDKKISVAVVVQKMIQSEVAGIAFSVHPVTQDANQMIIEAGFGLGEAIVSGQITPDSYVVEKNPRRIIDTNIATQTRSLIRANGSIGGNEWHELSEEEGKKPTLSEEQIFELADIILKIEQHYGFPCDIEWALEKGNFFITQSRPITTLKIGKTKRPLLSGKGTSQGVATGAVKIVRSVQDTPDFKEGNILVTKITDPTMVIMMNKAAAIVCDIGSITSHPSIISRELGIPCVVSTERGTQVLIDGMNVLVDGTRGEIYEI